MYEIQFKKISTIDPIVKYLAGKIEQQLKANKSVLWLVPGGSSIEIAAYVSQKLSASGADLSQLTVTLGDERYGEPNHPDSNWSQLQIAGFSLPGAVLIPVLNGKSLSETVEAYNKILEENLAICDYCLGFLGIGPDGHIAGIKPGSPAVEGNQFAAGYEWEDFTRLTMTPMAIARLDEVVSYAVGEPKRGVLDELGQDLSIDEQPAQIIKAVPLVTVYNDYKGEQI